MKFGSERGTHARLQELIALVHLKLGKPQHSPPKGSFSVVSLQQDMTKND
jgi:hypothetical protein